MELLDCFKIEVSVLKRQLHFFKPVCLRLDLNFQRHQCVVQEPVLGVESQVILPLDKCNVSAYVELVLEFRHQLEKHLLLLDEPKFNFFQEIDLVFLWLLLFVFRKHRFDKVCLLNVLAYLHVGVCFRLKVDEIRLLKTRDHH